MSLTASAPVPLPGYDAAPGIAARAVPGSRRIEQVAPAMRLGGLAGRVLYPGERERLEVLARMPFLADRPFDLPPLEVWSVPGLRVVHYPRMEGVAITRDGALVRECWGSPRPTEANGYVRMAGRQAELRRGIDVTGRLPRGALSYDAASHNFAHFMMIMLPRIVLLDHALADTPFLLPDLPDYAAVIRPGLSNDFMRNLDAVFAPGRGNAYLPTGPGLWEIGEAFLLDSGHHRWHLAAYPPVAAALSALAEEATRRQPARPGALPRRIYLSRQGARRRRVENHDAVEAVLAAHGFQTVQTEQLGFMDQAALFAQAEAVVAPHGAGLANLLFNDGRARVLELYAEGEPQYHFALCATVRGCRYMPLACRRTSKQRDMMVDVEVLRRGLDRLMAS
jgi:capsular polysaccharide biosynthesis protein